MCAIAIDWSIDHPTESSITQPPLAQTHASTPPASTLTQGLLLAPKLGRQQVRMLNVHEYIGMEIMKSFGIETPVVRCVCVLGGGGIQW